MARAPPCEDERSPGDSEQPASARSRASPSASSTPQADLPPGIGADPPARTRSGAPASTRSRAASTRVDVPRAAVDDAPVRRLRHQRGDQRALPLPARPRPDRPLDGVRHALADGPRLRPSPLARRGRPRGRGGRHARRHADAVRRDRPRRGVGVDDDQRARRDHARLLRRRRRAEPPQARGGRRSASRARSRRTSSRSTSPRRSGASRSTPRCACAAT